MPKWRWRMVWREPLPLIRYKCPQLDDNDFGQTPSDQAVWRVKFLYVEHHSILSSVSQSKIKDEEEVARTIALVPELCNLTGLTALMKADIKVMKDVAQITRVTPTQRQKVRLTHINNYKSDPYNIFCRLSRSSSRTWTTPPGRAPNTSTGTSSQREDTWPQRNCCQAVDGVDDDDVAYIGIAAPF